MDASPAPNRDRQGAASSTYLITFVCYGTWLPGNAGSVDRQHNAVGSPFAATNRSRVNHAEALMKEHPYVLDDARRRTVLKATQEVCGAKNGRCWQRMRGPIMSTW